MFGDVVLPRQRVDEALEAEAALVQRVRVVGRLLALGYLLFLLLFLQITKAMIIDFFFSKVQTYLFFSKVRQADLIPVVTDFEFSLCYFVPSNVKDNFRWLNQTSLRNPNVI